MRMRLCFLVLLLTPLLVYGPGAFKTYGMRDDYSAIRESHEEPGKLVRFDASQGRLLYGALKEASFGRVQAVSDLVWVRLTTVVLLTVFGLILWRRFHASGWPEVNAAAAALAIVLLPAAQIIVGWAIGWPYVLSLMLAVCGFAAIDTAMEKAGLRRSLGAVGGLSLYVLSALIYQSDVLFAIVPLAAATLSGTARRTKPELIRWFVAHVAMLLAALAIAFILPKFLFAEGVFRESSRMTIEAHPFTKLLWFLWEPLPNALGLFLLRDDFHTGELYFWLAVLAVAGFIGWVVRAELARSDGVDRLRWWLCLGILPWLAHLVSLVAAERVTGYRTLWALSGLVVVALFAALQRLPLGKRREPWVRHGVVGGLLAAGTLLAWHQTSALIAEPQAREWSMIDDTVEHAQLKKGTTKFYVIEPTLADRSTDRAFSDEFGSLSTNSDWVPKEMFWDAVRERFPHGPAKGEKIEYAQGTQPPASGVYDVVIDMRTLKHYRSDGTWTPRKLLMAKEPIRPMGRVSSPIGVQQ